MMKSILIIEDDITFGMMLKTWLGKKGFEVSSVSNIARAQKHIEGQGADLILSDLRLPDHDGIDLLKWMNEKGIDIPLIIMTGYADIQSAVQAMKLGARDYVAKPVNPEELLKKIRQIWSVKQQVTVAGRFRDIYGLRNWFRNYLIMWMRKRFRWLSEKSCLI